MGNRVPLRGFNHNVQYKQRVYHVQTEDSGVDNPHIFSHVFIAGMIVATSKKDYHELAQIEGHESKVRKLMQELHKQLMRQLKSGAFDAQIITLLGSLVPADAPPMAETENQYDVADDLSATPSLEMSAIEPVVDPLLVETAEGDDKDEATLPRIAAAAPAPSPAEIATPSAPQQRAPTRAPIPPMPAPPNVATTRTNRPSSELLRARTHAPQQQQAPAPAPSAAASRPVVSATASDRRSGVYALGGRAVSRPSQVESPVRSPAVSAPPTATGGLRTFTPSTLQRYTAPSRKASTATDAAIAVARAKRGTSGYGKKDPTLTAAISSPAPMPPAAAEAPVRTAKPPSGRYRISGTGAAQPGAVRRPAQTNAPVAPPPVGAPTGSNVVIARPAIILDRPPGARPPSQQLLRSPSGNVPSIFGAELITERSLDEVILEYLAEDADGGPTPPKR